MARSRPGGRKPRERRVARAHQQAVLGGRNDSAIPVPWPNRVADNAPESNSQIDGHYYTRERWYW